jgi:hypothetical protein
MNSVIIVIAFMSLIVNIIFGQYSAAIAWAVCLAQSIILAFGNQCTCK